jgi:hypothetical protein
VALLRFEESKLELELLQLIVQGQNLGLSFRETRIPLRYGARRHFARDSRGVAEVGDCAPVVPSLSLQRSSQMQSARRDEGGRSGFWPIWTGQWVQPRAQVWLIGWHGVPYSNCDYANSTVSVSVRVTFARSAPAGTLGEDKKGRGAQ